MQDRANTGEDVRVDSWKRCFLEKLHGALSRWAEQFEVALDGAVVPIFERLASFLRDNGFNVSTPLKEVGRRSFKCQLAENAFVLMIFHFSGVGEFELRSETFVPGAEPILEKSVGRLEDLDEAWAQAKFQTTLDRFVDLLAGETAAEPREELAAV